MTLAEFNTVLPEERTAIAFKGNFVDALTEKGSQVALYSHPHFYAEVFYDGKSNRITHCRAFTTLSLLAPYVNLT